MDDHEPTTSDPLQREPRDPLTTADLARADPGVENAGEARSFARGQPAPEDVPSSRPDARGAASTPLFSEAETADLRARWNAIQTGFVDAPRKAVEEADGAVAQAMRRLAEMFADERQSLEGQWDRGDDVSTEDLRLALQRYRSFFDRLLSV